MSLLTLNSRIFETLVLVPILYHKQRLGREEFVNNINIKIALVYCISIA